MTDNNLKGSNSDIHEKIENTKKEVANLKAKIKEQRDQYNDGNLKDYTKSNTTLTSKVKLRRTLKAHASKVYSMHWAVDKPQLLVSAAQDGKLIIWDALNANKLKAIALRSIWVMTCAFSPSANYVACGGLDNICSVYNVKGENSGKAARELNFHTGFISGCRFLNDKQILTCSGDKTCILWDIETASKITKYVDHSKDVMSLSLSPSDDNLFITGSSDKQVKVWDVKSGKCTQTFEGNADVNAVQFFPSGKCFAAASEDSTIRLYDLRADRELMSYNNENVTGNSSSLAFSVSGKYLFGGYDDHSCHVWDTLKGEKIYSLLGHSDRVSTLGVSHDGMALCTGSWDNELKIWA